MPDIELILTGKAKSQEPVSDIADTYRITIERGDGIACSDIEAQTVMSAYCMNAFKKNPRKPKKNSDKAKIDSTV
jgi:hypothetical protein